MKSLFSLLMIFVFTIATGCSQTSDSASIAKNASSEISFESIVHDYGTINQNENGEFEFVFKNTGNAPLVLQNVKPSCGCTASEWTKEPVAKNETGKIKVRYNTHIVGNFHKTITVYSNAETPTVVLTIKGSVVPVKEAAATDNQ